MHSTGFLRVLQRRQICDVGISAFNFVIWGGNSAVLQSEISFYGDAAAEL